MSTALAPIETDREQIELVRQTVARGCTDTELQLFLYTAKRTGLDPLLRQIHAVKRWDSNLGREAMAIQTGIDGYRLIADRTGHYSPGARTTYTYKKDGSLNSAVASVKKRIQHEWHIIEAEAFWDEYVGLKKDGKPNSMWATKPHIMLAKCAEALALRKAFPAELSGLYTHEEMDQAGEAKEKPQGSLRDRVMKQVEVGGGVLQHDLVAVKPERMTASYEPPTALPMEEAGPLPASVPPSQPPVVALPPPSTEPEYDWQKGIVTAITKSDRLTKAKKPWGTITFETIQGTVIEATWFEFSHPWSYDAVLNELQGKIIDVEYVLTPASDPKYKPTLAHLRAERA